MPYIGKPQSADAFRVTPSNIDSELKLAVSGSNDSEMALATASIAAITASISRLNDEISTDDTDMTLATASIAAITASISRIDSEIDTNSANMTLATASIAAITASLGQPVNTDSNVTFGVITSGDINSSGTITATEIHTTFVSSSIAVASGSNNFGDATDDHHSFTGSLSISGSLTATGSATVDGTLTVGGNIDFNSGTIDLSTQTVDVTLNGAVDALNFDSNTLSIDASNNRVGIGTAAPDKPLHILSSISVDGEARYNVLLHDTTNIAANVGAGIGFGGEYNGTPNYRAFGAIWGGKANSSSGNVDGLLKLGARTNSADDIDAAMTILGDGKVGIGQATPTTLLEIKGADVVTSGAQGAQLYIQDTADYNAAQVCGLQFRQIWHSDGSITSTSGIHGARESTASGQYGGALHFQTRVHGGDLADKMVIDSGGVIQIEDGMIVTKNDGSSTNAYMSRLVMMRLMDNLELVNQEYAVFKW